MSRLHLLLPAVVLAALAPVPVHAGHYLVWVHDARVVEGDAGLAPIEFEVVADGPPRRLTLGYSLYDVTATASGSDYSPAGGTFSLTPEPARLVGHWGAGSLLIPSGVALAPNGDVIAVDGPSNQVFRFSNGGTLLNTFAVTGPGTGHPEGVAVNSAGWIYVANFDGQVHVYHPNGSFHQSLGSTGIGRSSDIAVDSAGIVYVSDVENNRVHRFGIFGTPVGSWSTTLPGEPAFDGPLGIAVDAQGYVYVAKGMSGRILKYTAEGELVATWTDTKGFCTGIDLHVDGDGNVLIADYQTSRVVVLDDQGAFLTEWTLDDGPEHNPGEFAATAIVSDHEGNVYVGSRYSSSIAHYRWDRSTGRIVVPVAGDASFEPDEAFQLLLTPAANVTLLDAAAHGTIVNDDPELGPDVAPNGHFEAGMSGWAGHSGASLELSPDGIGGSQAARVLGPATLTPGLNDTPNLVDFVASGWRYRYSAWVRSTGVGAAHLRVREYLAGVQQAKTTSVPVAFDGSWQRLEVAVRARATGANLDFQVVGEFGAMGQEFLVDDVAVQALGADVPPVVEADADASGSWMSDVVVEVAAHEPEGEPIEVLEADLSGLPGATFTVATDLSRGTLRWRPSLEDVGDTPHVVTFTARNAAATSATTRIRIGPNIVSNPSFEQDVSGWSGHVGATLARVAGGRRDGYAARLTLPVVEWAGIEDRPSWTSAAGYGRRFVIGAWVRSATIGGRVRVQVKEYQGGVLMGSHSQIGGPVYGGELTPTWRRVMLAYTCVASGPSELDLSIDAESAGGGTFDVDEVSIVGVAGPTNVSVSDAPPLVPAARVVPNPARGRALLELAVPAAGRLRVELYDIAGRRHAVIADEALAEAGVRRFELRAPAGRLAPGIYWYLATMAGGTRQGRFVVLE